MSDNREQVKVALGLLGEAWRGDWSDFDGRTLRAQLDELAGHLDDKAKPFDGAFWAALKGICPVNGCWCEYCPERDEKYRMQCAHETKVRDEHYGRVSVPEGSSKPDQSVCTTRGPFNRRCDLPVNHGGLHRFPPESADVEGAVTDGR